MHYSETGTIKAISGLATFARHFSRVTPRGRSVARAKIASLAAVTTKVPWTIPDLRAGRAGKLTYVC
jgi:hypothetical protein